MTPQPHPSGCLWIPETRTAIVADLHLGYGLAQRRRGELGAVADTETQGKLQAMLEELTPSQLVLLGDTVHAPNPSVLEREWIRGVLHGIRCPIAFVVGNHDRSFAADFGVEVSRAWENGSLVAVHGDQEIPEPSPTRKVVIGHLHPAVSVVDHAGVRQRIPVFVEGKGIIVLPAFSPFAAGSDVSKHFPTMLAGLGTRQDFCLTAVTGKRLVRLGTIAGLSAAPTGSRPRDFWKYR